MSCLDKAGFGCWRCRKKLISCTGEYASTATMVWTHISQPNVSIIVKAHSSGLLLLLGLTTFPRWVSPRHDGSPRPTKRETAENRW